MTDITYFVSPNGLGHIVRVVAINRYLHNVSTKFVTANIAVQYLKQIGSNVEEVIDSPKFVVKNGSVYQIEKWLLEFYKYHKECKSVSARVIKQEQPEIVVSDEDYAALVNAQEQKIPSVLITNILELRFTKGFRSTPKLKFSNVWGPIIEKMMSRGMRNIAKKCDAVILPLEGEDHDNLRYVGPIAREINESREELRKKFSFNKKTIVISVGGTYDGGSLFERILKVSTKIKGDIEWIVISGSTVKRHYKENMRDLETKNNLHEIIFAADLIISLAGSATISESKIYGTPGIFIPIRGHFEHEESARKEGFTYDDINRLESLIIQKLDEKRKPQKNDGAKKAAEIIRNVMSQYEKK